MSVTDIAAYNADWLKAWTDKDVDRLCGFYARDCVYHDPQTAAGLKGNDALRAYLTGLFAATPPMTYTPDEVWRIPGGSTKSLPLLRRGDAGPISIDRRVKVLLSPGLAHRFGP